jgi:hypothetical protein
MRPQGAYEALLTGDKLNLTTNSLGAFSVATPQLAHYRFGSDLPGSLCKDAITNATIRFPMALFVPGINSTVINAIALLTVPVATDPAVTKLYSGKATDGRAPAYLWTQAYKLVGYDAADLNVSGALVGSHAAGRAQGKRGSAQHDRAGLLLT